VFRFVDVPAPPVPSLLRNFSGARQAPGRAARSAEVSPRSTTRTRSPAGIAGQQVATRMLLDRVAAYQGLMPALDPDFIAAMRQTLADSERDPALPPRRWCCRAKRRSPTR